MMSSCRGPLHAHVLVLSLCGIAFSALDSCELCGSIGVIGGPGVPYDVASLVVLAIRNEVVDGKILPVAKEDIYAGRLRTTLAKTNCRHWSFPVLAAGNYSLFAFLDLNADGKLSLSPPFAEPLGWYALAGSNWMTPIEIATGGPTKMNITINLWAAEPLPAAPRTARNGRLNHIRGIHSLHVWGTPEERGIAQGELLGAAVRDFFRFFTLQESIPSATAYEAEVLPFLRAHNTYPDDVIAEVRGIIVGMRHTIGEHGLMVPELGRKLSEMDLLFLNDYGCPFGCACAPPRTMERGHCSQFAFWGQQTRGTDAGGTVAGRNMDGENDIRKVTVSHFMAHAVGPSDESNRYVHFMWPGFVGTASGINEHGVYVMMNDGSSRPLDQAPPATNITIDTVVQREVLRRAKSLADVPAIINSYASSEGGTCANGCNLVFAQPSTNQRTPGGPAAMVYEGDRAGGVFRLPNDAPPIIEDGIMATNHFLVLGYSPLRPPANFGKEVYFSSLWRYEAGRRLVDVFAHYGQHIGMSEMQRLLQTVTHGTTEHSIIFRPDIMRIDIAIADLRSDGGWHAPYLNWTSYMFDDFFKFPSTDDLFTVL